MNENRLRELARFYIAEGMHPVDAAVKAAREELRERTKKNKMALKKRREETNARRAAVARGDIKLEDLR